MADASKKEAAGKNVPPEVVAIFDKYATNNVRQLKKPEALFMLETEFHLDKFSATSIFEQFDIDKDGMISLWEFKLFFEAVGNNAEEIVQKFKEMDTDNSGMLDPDETRVGLKQLKTGTGRALEDEEIEFFIKTSANEEGLIDVGRFTNLLYRLRLYDAEAPSHKH